MPTSASPGLGVLQGRTEVGLLSLYTINARHRLGTEQAAGKDCCWEGWRGQLLGCGPDSRGLPGEEGAFHVTAQGLQGSWALGAARPGASLMGRPTSVRLDLSCPL